MPLLGIEETRAAIRLLGWLTPAVVFGAIAARRWWQFGAYVTGGDPGNWIAVGRGLLGDSGKSSAAAYPPLVPSLLYVGQALVGVMPAAKIVAVGSLLAIMMATFVTATVGMERWFALSVTAMVGLSGLLTETVAFGGYPQNYAFALLILTASLMTRYLKEGRRGQAVLGSAMWSGTALSHHMYFALTCVVVVLLWLIWLSTRPGRADATQRTKILGFAGILATTCYVPTFVALHRNGYDPAINGSGVSLETAIRLGTRESQVIWLSVFVAGFSFVALTYRRRRAPTWQVAAALMAASLVFFPFTAEPRLLPPFLVGSTLGLGLLLRHFWFATRDHIWSAFPLVAAIALPTLLWPLSDAQASSYYGYYRMADRALLSATAFIDANHGGGIVVVRQHQKGWPVGWWFEGLTRARIAVGSQEKWLAFPEERSNAHLASLFFNDKRTEQQVVELARRTGVDFLVFRKWDWIGWQPWLAESDPGVEVAFDDGEFMILRLDSDARSAEAP